MSVSQSISVTGASTYASVSPQSGQSLQPFANLDLTEAQRTSLRAILTNAKKTGESRADVTKQINGVLTQAQQKTLASDRKAGPGPGGPPPSFANLDLTAKQSTALNSILANAKSTGESQADVQKQIDAILTTAQQQTLASDIKAGPPPPTAQASASSDNADADADASASDSSSTSTTVTARTALAAVTNIQNQATAAQAARINALLAQVVSTNAPTEE